MLYTTKDIINRAKDLADCSNTAFLSHEEEERYLNDSYNEVYQLAINRGDDNFVRRLEGYGSVQLPRDFYALRAVKGADGYMYKRKALSDSKSKTGYMIINNHIIVDGATQGVEISYYPMPKHLTIQREEKKYDCSMVGVDPVCYDNNDQFLVMVNSNSVVIYDLLNSLEQSMDIDNNFSHVVCSRSSFLIRSNVEYLGVWREYTYDCELIQEYPSYMSAVRLMDGTVVMEEVSFDYAPHANSAIVKGLDHTYYVDEENRLLEWDGEESTLIDEGVEPSSIHFKQIDKEDGICYYTTAPMIFSRGLDRSNRLEEMRQPLDITCRTFYGFTKDNVLYSDGVALYAKGNEPNVLMNYPNSTYFTLMAYTIATYLIAKQGGDVSTLAAQKEKALMDFYDFSEDDYNVVRIKDVY